jgi:hypothetical protein
LTVASSSEKQPTAARMKPIAARGMCAAWRETVRVPPAGAGLRCVRMLERGLERVKGIEPSS